MVIWSVSSETTGERFLHRNRNWTRNLRLPRNISSVQEWRSYKRVQSMPSSRGLITVTLPEVPERISNLSGSFALQPGKFAVHGIQSIGSHSSLTHLRRIIREWLWTILPSTPQIVCAQRIGGPLVTLSTWKTYWQNDKIQPKYGSRNGSIFADHSPQWSHQPAGSVHDVLPIVGSK